MLCRARRDATCGVRGTRCAAIAVLLAEFGWLASCGGETTTGAPSASTAFGGTAAAGGSSARGGLSSRGGLEQWGGGAAGGRSYVIADAGAWDAADRLGCETEADCSWNPLTHEILVPSDCSCRGCSVLMNQVTADRREAAYRSLCSEGVDGQGESCPASPSCLTHGQVFCSAGICIEWTD